MHAYLRPNVSKTSQLRISVASKILAITLELFAFVYLGMTIMQPQFYEIFTFVVRLGGSEGIVKAEGAFPFAFHLLF